MRYYLDTEFDGYGGELLSLALVPHDRTFNLELYLAWPFDRCTQWVAENVIPKLDVAGAVPAVLPLQAWPLAIQGYFKRMRQDATTEIVADWPDDLARFASLLLTGPGTAIDTPPGLVLRLERVDAYPTDLAGAVQHNALWDARALRHKLAGR